MINEAVLETNSQKYPDELYREAGFIEWRTIEGFGEIGVMRFLVTMGICVHIDPDPKSGQYEYRYCYEDFCECMADFFAWDGKGDPEGKWIKKKGKQFDETNPRLKEWD